MGFWLTVIAHHTANPPRDTDLFIAQPAALGNANTQQPLAVYHPTQTRVANDG